VVLRTVRKTLMKHVTRRGKTAHHPTQDPYGDMTVICKHCSKPIEQVKLIGFSLICPLCGKPQNGQSHLKI
jgi:predicted amidophosphoribosyltransferase